MTKAIAKSTSAANTAANGTMIRGKYTLEMRLALRTRLVLDRLMAVEKKVQGRSAVYEKTGYGTVPDETCISLPKMMEKTTIVRNGCRIAQAAPMTVCL